jgi:hypothetical protein
MVDLDELLLMVLHRDFKDRIGKCAVCSNFINQVLGVQHSDLIPGYSSWR